VDPHREALDDVDPSNDRKLVSKIHLTTPEQILRVSALQVAGRVSVDAEREAG
jgi:hypothetical protein